VGIKKEREVKVKREKKKKSRRSFNVFQTPVASLGEIRLSPWQPHRPILLKALPSPLDINEDIK
jgi:hypothetical protein